MNGLVLNLTNQTKGTTITNSMVNMLLKLNIAQSDRKRKCLRHAIYSASGMTPTEAQRVSREVEEALLEAQSIREAISNLAQVEDQALLKLFGIEIENAMSSSEFRV